MSIFDEGYAEERREANDLYLGDPSFADASDEADDGRSDVDFPVVILDALGVVDRVSTEQEALEYIASMPDHGLRYEQDGG